MGRIHRDDYPLTAALTSAGRHRPVWSWRRWRKFRHVWGRR
ncbi:hypothetical protein [Micromonospora matsumotoense]